MSILVKTSFGFLLASVLSVSAQAQQNSEAYYIFDIPTSAPASEVGDVIRKALKKKASSVNVNAPLVMQPTPEKPGRFEIVDMTDNFAGSGMGGLMALAQSNGSGAFKTAKCDGAVWTGHFARNQSNHSYTMHTCLFPYQGGYSLNIYAQNSDKGHGAAPGRKLAGAAVSGIFGKSKDFVQNEVIRMRKKVFEKLGVAPELTEGQPLLDFSFKDEPKVEQAPE